MYEKSYNAYLINEDCRSYYEFKGKHMKFHTMKKGLRQAAILTINVRCLKFHTMKFNSKGVQSQIASLPIWTLFTISNL